MTNEREANMDYPPLDSEGNVTDGSVDNYDFDWGEGIVLREEQLPPKHGEWPYHCCFEWPDCWPCPAPDPCPDPDPCPCPDPDPCPCPDPDPCPDPEPCPDPCHCNCGCRQQTVIEQKEEGQDYEIKDI